ncbi:MAG: phosphoesterase, PA-phosphatase related protein [Frankiales bacterium]|nr:phosphoesterase, PA-phosphatase related protein [Frankiales bacterium]
MTATSTDERPVGPPPRDEPDESVRGPLLRVWAVVAAFTLVMVARSVQVGIPPKDPRGSLLLSRVAISLGLLVALVLVDAVRRAGWTVRPGAVARSVRARWTPRRLGLVLLALAAYHLVYVEYRNLKSWDVLNTPRDEMLLRWDRWLFFGHSPHVLLHDLLGQGIAARVLVVWYETFGWLVCLSFVAALVLQPRLRQGYVHIASAMWVWILGTASYYAIPSLGPFQAVPEEFAGLPHSMVQETQATYMAQRAHLLADPQAADAFASISAFASLHVGVTTLMLLMARYYGLRWTSRLLAVFLAGTMVATVYVGWHFAVDVPAGLLVGWLGVRLGRWTVDPPVGGRAEGSGRGTPLLLRS